MTGDVGVIGGGPGAAAAAATLAEGGARVTLFRPRHPGEKPCGGAVPEQRLPAVPAFEPSLLPSVSPDRALLENASGRRLEMSLGGIRVFRRRDLDPALVAAAVSLGVEIVEQKVEGLSLSGDSVEIRIGSTRRRFSWLIGADGARGLSRRTLSLPPGRESVALGASLAGVKASELVLAFPGVADAYAWIFPRPEGVSVGLAYSPEELSGARAASVLGRFLDRHLGAGIFDAPQASRCRYRYPIPVFSERTLAAMRRGLAHRVLLVGDAAGLADPLTREGIRHAMVSGLWAARSLLAQRPEDYAQRIERRLGEELGVLAARASGLFFRTPVGQWMVPVCRLHPGIRRVLRELLACLQPYRGLRRRLLRAAVGLS